MFFSDHIEHLLQTVFICAFMIFAPLFGYWGDRFPRKPIMILGISIWVAAVAAATFVPATTDNPRKVRFLLLKTNSNCSV